ncbi:MAG: sensor histidine kinase, partial [Candidatus Limnocylindria bacterium]
MTALELISLVTQVLFVGLFVAVLWHALRQPTRARLDTVLLFGSITLVVLLARALELLGLSDEPWAGGLLLLLLNIAPYAMIRLVDDFSGTPRWIQVGGAAAFALIAVFGAVGFETARTTIEVASLIWFLVVGGYAAFSFARAAASRRGITRRRMAAVATGAGLFIAAIGLAFAGALAPGLSSALDLLVQLVALAAVIAFFLGFAPPLWIRRAWREPDLRAFLERSMHLTGLSDDREAMAELQRAAADTFGASGSAIGIADSERPVLRYLSGTGDWVEYPNDAFVGGLAFMAQHRMVVMDALRTDPEHAAVYERAGANTVIAAPVTAEGRRMGVLTVYADRAPIFVEDDLWLIELLADQTAVLLEARALTTQATELRGREEAARLKEEFLSAAAHDLRTPLTVVLGQAELVERRLARDPTAQVDSAGISRIAREARHLRDLVSELLDAQRLEQGLTVMDRAPADLGAIVEAVRARHVEHGVPLTLEGPDTALIASIDRPRIEQVIENLLENALKYGADDQVPEMRIWQEGREARIAVIDHGAGVPEAERERIFERFYRAKHAPSITDTGMGLGLYICRRIVEEHGGRIWAEATPGGGTTFTVSLPLEPDAAPSTDEEAEGPV